MIGVEHVLERLHVALGGGIPCLEIEAAGIIQAGNPIDDEDPKATDVAVIAPRVESAPLHAVTLPARQPPGYDRNANGTRRLRKPPVSNRAICGHWRRPPRSIDRSSVLSAPR